MTSKHCRGEVPTGSPRSPWDPQTVQEWRKRPRAIDWKLQVLQRPVRVMRHAQASMSCRTSTIGQNFLGETQGDLWRTSAKCKNRTTVLLVQHPAPWSPWSPWSTLIHLGPQFPQYGYTKWTKQDQGGPWVDQGHGQDHGAGWWTSGIQDHRGPHKNFFLMSILEEISVGIQLSRLYSQKTHAAVSDSTLFKQMRGYGNSSAGSKDH